MDWYLALTVLLGTLSRLAEQDNNPGVRQKLATSRRCPRIEEIVRCGLKGQSTMP
jgi:hypothetical protein